ncbi:MAG: hypothetical protein LBM01_02515 [Christensenellaceae bacterium]|jgi:hypothetical protein|nr:hypothetical protein [Christensenellaceae bacterium]
MAEKTIRVRSSFFDALAYWAIILISVVLLITGIFKTSGGAVIEAIQTIGYALATLVVLFYSFFYARARRGWYLIAWIVAFIFVLLGYILPLVIK